MVTALNILIIIIGSVATLCAFGGDTWTKGPEPLAKRITGRGWFSLFCLVLAIIVGSAKEITSAEETKISEAAADHQQKALQQQISQTILENQKAEAASIQRQKILQDQLSEAMNNLTITRSELSSARQQINEEREQIVALESNLNTAISHAVSGIPREIDHSFYTSEDRTQDFLRSSENDEYIKVNYGDVLSYYFNTNDVIASQHYSISFEIGDDQYPIDPHAPTFGPSQIRVAGRDGVPMRVRILNRSGLHFSMKLAVVTFRH